MTTFRPDLTEGERSLIEAYLLMSLISTFGALMVFVHLDGGAFHPSPYLFWVVASGGVAGAAALRMVRDRLGHSGPRGILGSAAAAFAATFLIGLVGGSLALPIYGTMFGPFSLVVTLLATPGLALSWAACFILAHMRIRRWHRERDSIFAYRPLP